MGESLYDSYLSQKGAQVEKLLLKTQAIVELMSGKDYLDLDILMNERSEIIEEIDNLDRVYKDQCKLASANLTSEHKLLLVRMKENFLRVQELDVQIRSLLPEQLIRMQQEYGMVKNIRKVQNAYENNSSQSVFVDRER